MTLIKCTECGREISDSATNCVQCGASVSKKSVLVEKDITYGQKKYCVGCGKHIHLSAKSCPHCGFTDKPKSSNGSNAAAVVGLIINIIIFPGLGTIIAGGGGAGIIQLVFKE